MSNLRQERTNWEVLSDDLANDGITVAACVMNPKQAGGLQTRERLYQVWYNHEAAKAKDLAGTLDDASVAPQAQLAVARLDHLNLNAALGLKMEHFLLPVGELRVAAAREAIRVEVCPKPRERNASGTRMIGRTSTVRMVFMEETKRHGMLNTHKFEMS